MNEQCKKMLITIAITNFGIPTGVINGILAYVMVKQPVTMSGMFAEMLIGCFFCGLIIPFFAPLVLISQLKKHPDLTIGLRREKHIVSRFIPLNLFAGAIVIAVLTTILFALLPFGVGLLLDSSLTVQPLTWILFKGFYNILVAAAAGYFGTLNTLYAYASKGRVSIGA